MAGARVIRPILILVIILSDPMLCAGLIYAQNNLYVSPDGIDVSAGGSLQAPFRTIDYAANLAQPGDSIFLLEGTYRNANFDNDDIWDSDKLATISVNGTPDNYITFLPFPGHKVLLEFDGTYGIIVKNSSYVRVVGLEIKGINDQITPEEAIGAWGLYKDQSGVVHDLAAELGLDLADPQIIGQIVEKPSQPNISKPSYYNGRGLVANQSHHIEFINNLVHDCPSSAIRAQQSDFILVEGNKVYNNTFWTTQGVGAITVAEATNVSNDKSDESKILLVQNEVFGNENRLISWNPSKSFINMVIDEGTGLFLTRNRDTYNYGRILIANNLAFKNGASGIVCHFTNRAIIEHNTVVYNGTTNTGQPGGIGINNADNVEVRNNISYSRSNKWALGIIAEPVTNLTVENNIIFNSNGEQPVYRKIESGWTEEDPLFTDLAADDFKLLEGSPCINKGSLETITNVDFFGQPRADGLPDIGALEYQQVTMVFSAEKFPGLQVYPNPITDILNIEKGVVEIEVFNLLGRRLQIKCVDGKADFSGYPAGTYIIKTATTTHRVVKR